MTILCLGLSFRTATIDLREHLSLDRSTVQLALGQFRAWRDSQVGPDAELVVLSTCNRLELYLAASSIPSDQAASALTDFLTSFHGIVGGNIEPNLYRYDQLDAVRHLCRVAAGLDSMVLGESQILGQVSESFELASSEDTAGYVLSNLFRIAVRAGKRAQTETTIGRNPISVGSVAVNRAEQEIGRTGFLTSRVVVVGAGEMAGLVMKALRARGVKNTIIANRTLAHAVALAHHWGAEASDLAELPALIKQADVVITSTGSPDPVIRLEHVQQAMQERPQRPLVLLDIALPRDIEPSAGDLPGVRLINLDNLQSVVDASLVMRESQIPAVQAMVEAGVREFDTWMRGAAIHPVIAGLRHKAEAIRQQELDRAMRHLHDLDPKTRDYIQGLTHSIVNKLLHEPTTRLRAAAADEHAITYADSIRYLFDLNDDGAQNASGPGES